ncbi:hypothetical protein I6L78_12085 [Proteus vulgaris]|uniref:hypothetical protein n=1 Tax=Proteus vulgaris TaxID=585 RepID=UPI001C5BC6B4|nr:hypothetical protein [Proteus vulgaris]MBW3472839.1 hypothetical protein [Proteus vulgaris]
MMSIKIDSLKLNKFLISEQNSDNKAVFSKELSSLSDRGARLPLEKGISSSEEDCKIKQKLNEFYNLEHKEFIDLKNKIKLDKAIDKLKDKDEKDEKDEGNDGLNIEGLLLTQKKIYSQVCSHFKKNKLEQKILAGNVSHKNNLVNASQTKSNLSFTSNLESNKENVITHSEVKKENQLINNKLSLLTKHEYDNKKPGKLEKKHYLNKLIKSNKNHKENKPAINEQKEGIDKIKLPLKSEEGKLISDSLVIENNYSLTKGRFLENRSVDKKELSFEFESGNLNIGDLHKEKIKENVNDVSIFNSIKPEYQQMISGALFNKKLLDIPVFSLLHKKVSMISQPPSITYVFKKWGNELHQMKINFDTDRKIQLIASTGRVYQSSLENFNQYQGRLSLSLENDNHHWRINEVDPSTDNNKDEK